MAERRNGDMRTGSSILGFRKNDVSQKRVTGEHRDRLFFLRDEGKMDEGKSYVILPAVENGCRDFYLKYTFFDFSYADVGNLRPTVFI